jgi:hypothetical protein
MDLDGIIGLSNARRAEVQMNPCRFIPNPSVRSNSLIIQGILNPIDMQPIITTRNAVDSAGQA